MAVVAHQSNKEIFSTLAKFWIFPAKFLLRFPLLFSAQNDKNDVFRHLLDDEYKEQKNVIVLATLKKPEL